ncbi:putative phage abortive infection protein [Mesorhizobium sp.]|uniref:putative phage abortive infection protein n=1 Tax=Mesorhizobium sp. TaxID=1871066 RepID=UPI0025FD8F16|nr:putative phage abortive infection protein [Mesorhizobium sp.]
MLIPWDAPTVGQWGDSFGALNALMSTLAFAAVFFTLRLQQRQINDAQRDQHIQRFESTYFEVLHLFREAREAFQYKYGEAYVDAGKIKPLFNSLTSGLDAVRRANFEILWRLGNMPIDEIKPQFVGDVYEAAVIDRYESSTGPYFRLFYTILFRIRDDNFLTPTEKRRYANLFRSQLSSHEVALAGFNGLNPVSKDLATLIIEFRILKYLPDEFGRKYLARCYPPQAFEDRPD